MKKIPLFLLFLAASFCGAQIQNLQITYPLSKSPNTFTDENCYFIWSDSLLVGVAYYFKLVEVYKGQTPAIALEMNPTIFETKVYNYYFRYPWYAPPLTKGDYACEVSSLYESVSTRTGFRVLPNEYIWYPYFTHYNYYTPLEEKLDGSVQYAVDKFLYIHYKELYTVPSSQGLRYRVYDMNRTLLVDTDEDGNVLTANAPLVPIRYGENYLRIDLSLVLASQTETYYILEVRNAKGETWFLRFSWLSSQPYIYEVTHEYGPIIPN